ncbi:MAG: transcriptional regulator, LysR family [Marmoricola sp.]|jgi:DNA-binding transcriptional LysR family regulator|nr:transcriptional regulator, LysR family [Marmoricola sp.]
MDTFRLECFVALAEELHFHRAAERCHITQPAMSQQIRRLEEELGVQVATRTKRSVSLTRAGEVFLGEARKTLRQMEQSISLARRTDSGEIGQLRVGVTAPALYVLFPEIARRFAHQLPGMGLVVKELTTAQQEGALRDGDIEVGVMHPPLDDRSLFCQVVAEPAFHLALPTGHRLAHRESIALAELANDGFVLFPREIGPQLYDTIIGLCQSAGFSPKIAQEAHPAQSIIAFVSAGVGIGLIASPVQRLDRPGVVYVPIDGPRPYLSLGVAWHQETRSPAVGTFIQTAREVGAQLEE